MKLLWQSRFAAALEHPQSMSDLELAAAGQSQVAERLAVHRSNVQAARIGVLRLSFPILQQLLGEEYFGALAAAFIAEQPPRSAVLHAYGGTLADFILPLESLPYLADMARLEWARPCAFHAADTSPSSIQGLSAAAIKTLLIRPLCWHPSVTLLCSQHPLWQLSG